MARRSTSRPPVLPGYSYLRPLGSGGFADVFLYEQDMPRRIVAVKVLVDDAINPDVLRTFTAEADILARLSSHPSIVTIYQAGISADGRPYFVMEYCPDTLAARARIAPLAVADVLDAGVRVASALETAHRSGVLHRDIKPSNVLLTALEAPVLADFGIAATLQRADDDPGPFAMSVPWSAPEVIQELTTGTVATEVWGLGATLFTLLTGRAPFESPTGSALGRDQHRRAIISGPTPTTGREDVPARAEQALARCLQKEPSLRFPTALALAEELRWAQYEAGLQPTPLDIASPAWAAAAGPLDLGAPRESGITTVRPASRRAERAQRLASAERRRDQPAPARTRSSSKRAAWWGALGGGVLVAIVMGVLTALGVFG